MEELYSKFKGKNTFFFWKTLCSYQIVELTSPGAEQVPGLHVHELDGVARGNLKQAQISGKCSESNDKAIREASVKMYVFGGTYSQKLKSLIA